MTMTMTMTMTNLFRQVTYAFCKEFASLLSELVTSEGDLPVVKILTTIFEQVDLDDDIFRSAKPLGTPSSVRSPVRPCTRKIWISCTAL